MWCPSRVNIGSSVFSLYVNDLPTHNNFNVNLFADNTVLTMKNKSLLKFQATVNCELAIVDDWMKFNRLSLNYSKSTYFIVKPFSYNSKNIALDNFNVSYWQCCARQQKILTALASASPFQILIGVMYADNDQKC